MRWFKHYTDNHRGTAFQKAFDQLGYQAYSIYVLMEICAEKYDKQRVDDLGENADLFVFQRTYLQSVLRMKRRQTDLVLALFSELNWFQAVGNDLEIIIKFPKFADLFTSDQFRAGKSPIRARMKPAQEEELELSLESEPPLSPTEKPKPENRESGSDAATQSKKSGKQPRLMAIASNPVSNFEARFKTYEDPRRIEFMQTIAILAKAIPPISGVFNRERFLVDAMMVFPTAEEFDAFAQGLIDSVKTARPKDVRAYASAIWREQVSRNRDNPPLELPSLEGIDGV